MKSKITIKKIGILTGGGDCPGLNAVIRAVVKTAVHQYGLEVVGFLQGYLGMVKNMTRILESSDASGILHQGGTILGTSNRDNPFRFPLVGIPKTIDNDLWGTDVTFGFNTALQTAMEAIDKLQTTAASHHRVMVVEGMGRYAGWIALQAGVASGGDVILIPEIPYNIERAGAVVRKRHHLA